MTATAVEFVAYATALAAAAKGYGQRAYNGLPQRGPDYWDCIGFVRDCLLAEAPTLWPSNRGGEDSWTVPNFLYWWQTLHLGAIDAPSSTPLKGDVLIFGASEHIGIADGAGNCIASTPPRPCSTPIARVGLPLTHILRTAMAQTVPGIVTVGVLPDDPAIRLIGPTGGYVIPTSHALRSYVLGKPVTIPGYSVTGEATSPAHEVIQDGVTYYLLDRNFVPASVR